MSKVLITGGLGYIGTVLTNLYSDNSDNDITVIDKKRDLVRENELLNRDINFKEVDILDKKELKKIIVLKIIKIKYNSNGFYFSSLKLNRSQIQERVQ